MLIRVTPLLAFVLLAACATTAQPARTLTDDEWCENERRGDRERACEVRETVISARSLTVDATPNGGVSVKVWDRADVLVRAKVSAAARRQADAERLVQQTQVRTRNGQVGAATPRTNGDAWVSVSYEIFAPRRTNLNLHTTNGGVSVHGIAGSIEANAVNGGISLNEVGGSVRARTTNGGVSIALAGDAWDGEGLDVESTNGGISITLPENYSAELSAQTQMGRISTSGLTLNNEQRERGRWTGDEIRATLGRGGARLRAVTHEWRRVDPTGPLIF